MWAALTGRVVRTILRGTTIFAEGQWFRVRRDGWSSPPAAERAANKFTNS